MYTRLISGCCAASVELVVVSHVRGSSDCGVGQPSIERLPRMPPEDVLVRPGYMGSW